MTSPADVPGEVLRDHVRRRGLTGRGLARELGWSPNRITEILNGERSITAETAIGLAKRFGTKPEFWMTLQMNYDLERAAKAVEDANGNV